MMDCISVPMFGPKESMIFNDTSTSSSGSGMKNVCRICAAEASEADSTSASADVTHTVLLNRVFIIPLNRLTFWGTPIFLLIWNNLSA